jgi:peptide/nickel transport system substrate-binding protein
MLNWHSKEICGKANRWQCNNTERFSNPDYDRLLDQFSRETDTAKRKDLAIQMNDLLVRDVVIIPLVNRVPVPGARSKELKGVQHNAWDLQVWNIAAWAK